MNRPDWFATRPQVAISLLQGRPQSRLETSNQVHLPENLREEDTVFSSHFIVPQGFLSNIRHVIFVPPEGYFALPTLSDRNAIGRLIGRLNAVLEEKTVICVGLGRWGTTIDLGALVYYSDICDTGTLVDLSGSGVGASPEPFLGTHFFQDLMEAQTGLFLQHAHPTGTIHAPALMSQRLPAIDRGGLVQAWASPRPDHGR